MIPGFASDMQHGAQRTADATKELTLKIIGKKQPAPSSVEEGTTTAAQRGLEALPPPVTGDAGGAVCCGAAGSVGGFVGGAVVGIMLGACVTVEIWGVGAGLWVEGEKAEKDAMVTAGRIMVLYVAIPLVGMFGCCGGCYGGALGGAGGASLGSDF